jgi:transketolase
MAAKVATHGRLRSECARLCARAVPNLTVIRPADATEAAQAWRAALLNTDGPTALILTRQKLPVLDRTELGSAEGLQRGGYVLWQSADGTPDAILIGAKGDTPTR